jgi:AmmeMemoRadiSam system protein A
VLPEQPLYLAVAQNAFNAAFRDPRFLPLTREEFQEVELEISVMTIPEPVTNFRQIEVGRDGLIVRKGGAVGLLLPQVATEYGWDREQFLSYTCAKAGLPPRTWQDGTCRVEKFTAEVLSELPASA